MAKGEQFVGKWKFVSSDNFEAVLLDLGVGFIARKAAAESKPTVVIDLTDEVFTLKTESLLKTTEIKFKIGEEFDETTADGRKVKSIFNFDGDNVMVQTQDDGKKVTTIRRTVTGDDMDITISVGDIQAKRVYKRA